MVLNVVGSNPTSHPKKSLIIVRLLRIFFLYTPKKKNCQSRYFYYICIEIRRILFLPPKKNRDGKRWDSRLKKTRFINLSIYPKSNSLNMKNYNFIPHAANTRSRSQVINLIEAEGAAGYGFYWALLEYLRTQPRYTGDIRAIKNIARQMKVRIDKALRILND